jgi:GT2 family glycosyltransferase/glycosyltransferase involved in cell wall biosynthesis
MLALLGRRWDDLVPLPGAWLSSDAAFESAQMIGEYVRNDRATHALWALKDPRLCEFGAIWRDEALRAGMALGVVLAVRHPWEVARSLASRDGLSAGHGLLLWLHYTVSALQVADGLPTVVVSYSDVVADWRAVAARIQTLPGGRRLEWGDAAAAELDEYIDAGERHHAQSHEDGSLPTLVADLWGELEALSASGAPPVGLARRAALALAPTRELLTPIVGDFRVVERKLWERVGRAEAALAADADQASLAGNAPDDLSALLREQHRVVMEALSNDIRHMQGTVAAALERSARNEGRVAQLEGRDLAELRSVLDAGLQSLGAVLAAQAESGLEGRSADASTLARIDASSLAVAAEVGQLHQALAPMGAALDALGNGILPVHDSLVALARTFDQLSTALAGMDAHARQQSAAQEVATSGIAASVAAQREELAARLAAITDQIASRHAEIRNEQAALHAALADAGAQERKTIVATVQDADARVRAGIGSLTERVDVGLVSLGSEIASLGAGVAALRRERVLQDALERGAVELADLRTALAVLESAHAEASRKIREGDASAEVARHDIHVLRGERDASASAAADSLARIATLESELAAVRAESSRRRAQLHALRHESELLARVVASRSWRWTRPFRALARLLTGRWGEGDRAALRALLARAPATRRRDAEPDGCEGLEQGVALVPSGEVQLEPASARFADVFVWAVIDWDFRFQRPQHLARSLANRGHRVFYISNNFVDSATAGFRADPIDGSGRLFQVNLHLAGAPAIYFGLPDAAQVEALRASLAALLAWTRTDASMSIVQHPYWSMLVRAVPNARVIYDCMDHHAGFENNASSVLEAETMLLRDSDLVVVTSLWLEHEVRAETRNCALVRNACEFEFFRESPAKVFRDPQGRKVIGYYGAIAEWFDLELVRAIAVAHPDSLVLLVGSDTIGAGQALSDLHNVEMVGEVRYDALPYWLHAFDVALLPFRVIPLTLATNPVKVYEYLAAGKPVVVVDVPEMAQFEGLVRVGRDIPEFVGHVTAALVGDAGAEQVAERQRFAAGQTWDHRARAIDEAIASISEPLVSVVVLTYNNLAFTQACLFSIENYSDYPNLEVIVVDNASSDGSREWLADWVGEASAAGQRRRLILNEANVGFSAGNNVGLEAASGELLILLNNDTYVTRGWVRTLAAHFRRDPRLGLLGPVTNNIGNEAKLDVEYADITEMHRIAGEYTRAHPGAILPMRNAAFFCVAMPRAVYAEIGGLDEAFGVGFFEDDDYCRRVEARGWHIACAEDVFVHHHLSASFAALGGDVKRALFDRNKAIYEAKWGAWEPHAYRPSLQRAAS